MKLSYFPHESCVVNYCFVNGDALVLSVQGFVQWINDLQFSCGEALVLSAL